MNTCQLNDLVLYFFSDKHPNLAAIFTPRVLRQGEIITAVFLNFDTVVLVSGGIIG